MKKGVNEIKRGPLANSIVFHDFEALSVESFMEWFDYALKLFKEYQLIPNRMGVTGPEIRSRSTVTLQGGIRQLEKVNVQTLQGVEIYANPAIDEKNHSLALLSVSIDLNTENKNKSFVFVVDNQIMPFDPVKINQLTANFAHFLKPKYGYAYQRPFDKGPTWYPFGICVGLDREKDREERAQLTKWNHKYHINDRYTTGDLRDIYPMNLLSKAHQEHRIEGKPFFEWIEESPSHGTLTLLDDSLWAWWVKNEDIPSVRALLRPLGWVIAI